MMTVVQHPKLLTRALAVIALTVGASAAFGQHTRPAQLALRIAIVADASQPTLEFLVRNLGPGSVPDLGLARNFNSIEILSPSGQITHYISFIETFTKPPELVAGRSERWMLATADLLRMAGMDEAGTYRLYWEYHYARSAELLLTREKSNPKVEAPPIATGERRRFDTPKNAARTLYFQLDGAEQVPKNVRDDVGEHWPLLFQRTSTARHFIDRSRARFGEGAVMDWFLEATPDRLKKLEDARVLYSDYFEEATIDVDPPVRLVRVDNFWKVRASSFLRDDQSYAAFQRGTEMLQKIGQAVTAGKYETFGDADKALREGIASQVPTSTEPSPGVIAK